MSVVFQSPPVYGFDVMNEPVAGQHFFKSLVCVVMAFVAWMVMMREVNGDEGGDDDAGDDVLQIADFTANHLSCFSWWLHRCQEDCAQSQKYKIQRNTKKIQKKLFPASHGGVQRCQVTCAQTATAHTIFTQVKKKIHLSY